MPTGDSVYIERDESIGPPRDVWRIVTYAARERRSKQGSSARPVYMATVYSQADAERIARLLNAATPEPALPDPVAALEKVREIVFEYVNFGDDYHADRRMHEINDVLFDWDAAHGRDPVAAALAAWRALGPLMTSDVFLILGAGDHFVSKEAFRIARELLAALGVKS